MPAGPLRGGNLTPVRDPARGGEELKDWRLAARRGMNGHVLRRTHRQPWN